MKTRRFALCLATVFLVAIYINIQRSHTFTLSNDEGTIKTEQIQPLWGTVKVSGDCDTEVVFTDVETQPFPPSGSWNHSGSSSTGPRRPVQRPR